ncbi:restriction endonuclease subunit S [Polaromonas sp. P5_D5]
MQRHEKYKPSGAKWIGDVPAHWDVRPGFTCFEENKDRNKKLTEKTVLSLSYGRIVVKPEEKMTGLVPESFDTYQLIKPGDIVIRTTDLQNDQTSLRVGLAHDGGMITSAYLGLRCKPAVSPAYMFRVLESYDALKVFYGMGSGLRQNMDFGDFKRLLIPIPPKEEQGRIVTFLDQKTAEINNAIGKKAALIGLIQEQKTILINQAVTQGINASAPRRDSGVPWLDPIPAHWKVIPNRYVFREQNQRSLKGEEIHLSMSQRYGLVPAKELDIQTLQSESYDGAKLCREGDLVQNRLKAHLAVFGVAPCDGLVSPDYSVFRLRDQTNQPIFFERLFKAPGYLAEFNRRVRGIVVGFLRLYSEDFNAIPAIVPPADEQADIVKFINRVNEDFATMQGKIETEISALKEMRSALIAESVTGKIKI